MQASLRLPPPPCTRTRATRAVGVLLLLALVSLVAPACRGGGAAGRGPRDAGRAPASDASLHTRNDMARAGAGAEPGEQRGDQPIMTALAACPAAGATGKGTLRVHLATDPPHLDPLDDGSELSTRVLFGLVYEPLLRCEPPDGPATPARAPGGLRGVLAERWQVAPAGDAISIELRADARFHDQRPVTSTDVRASLEAVWRGGGRMPAVRAALSDLAAIDRVSASSLRLRLKKPGPLVLRALCDVPIVPAGWLPGRRSGHREPIGSGPFRFDGWVKGKRLRLVRVAAGAGAEAIEFVIEPSTGKALGRLRRGELDVIPQLDAVHFPDQVRPAALGPDVALYGLPGERTTFIAVNHQRAPLGALPVRRALSLLWDRAALAEEIHRGLATPIAAPVGAPPVPAFDPGQAGRLLREAGVTPPARVRGRAQPFQTRLAMLHAPSRLATAELRRLGERLRRLGVLLDLVPLEPGAIMERLRAGDFDLALVSWRGRPGEDPRVRFGARAPFNFGGHRSPRLEALLEELRAADAPAERPELDRRLGLALADELPAIFLYRHTELALAARRVRGLCNDGGRLRLDAAGLAP